MLQITTHPNLSHDITIPSLHHFLLHCSKSFWGEVPPYTLQTACTLVGGMGLVWLKPQEGSHCNTTVEPHPDPKTESLQNSSMRTRKQHSSSGHREPHDDAEPREGPGLSRSASYLYVCISYKTGMHRNLIKRAAWPE